MLKSIFVSNTISSGTTEILQMMQRLTHSNSLLSQSSFCLRIQAKDFRFFTGVKLLKKPSNSISPVVEIGINFKKETEFQSV
jgi:hypothetical protein